MNRNSQHIPHKVAFELRYPPAVEADTRGQFPANWPAVRLLDWQETRLRQIAECKKNLLKNRKP